MSGIGSDPARSLARPGEGGEEVSEHVSTFSKKGVVKSLGGTKPLQKLVRFPGLFATQISNFRISPAQQGLLLIGMLNDCLALSLSLFLFLSLFLSLALSLSLFLSLSLPLALALALALALSLPPSLSPFGRRGASGEAPAAGARAARGEGEGGRDPPACGGGWPPPGPGARRGGGGRGPSRGR